MIFVRRRHLALRANVHKRTVWNWEKRGFIPKGIELMPGIWGWFLDDLPPHLQRLFYDNIGPESVEDLEGRISPNGRTVRHVKTADLPSERPDGHVRAGN